MIIPNIHHKINSFVSWRIMRLVLLFAVGSVNIFNEFLFPKQIHNCEVMALIEKYKELTL